MNAKEYLSQAFQLDQRINSKLDMLSALKEMATKSTAVMQSDVVSRTQNAHAMEDVIAKIVDLQAEINADIDHLVDLKRDIIHAIYAVESPVYQTLLELRYISYRSWEEIAKQMNCTISNVYKIHSKALNFVVVPKIG